MSPTDGALPLKTRSRKSERTPRSSLAGLHLGLLRTTAKWCVLRLRRSEREQGLNQPP